MPEQRLLPYHCISARQQLADYILSRMKVGHSQSQILAEIVQGDTLDSDIAMLVYLAQARRSANPRLTTRTVKRWLLDNIPDPKQRLKAHAMELLAEHDPDEVCRMMGITRHTLNYWKRTHRCRLDVTSFSAMSDIATEGADLA